MVTVEMSYHAMACSYIQGYFVAYCMRDFTMFRVCYLQWISRGRWYLSFSGICSFTKRTKSMSTCGSSGVLSSGHSV